jgi:hypothetical protein
MGTAAFDVKDKIVALAKADSAIAAALGTESSDIWDSSYSTTTRPRRLLWFGETTWEGEEPATFGANLKRVETFEIRFGVEILEGTATQTESNHLARDVFVAVEAMLRDPRVLQIGGIESLGIVPIGIGEGPAGTNGRATLMAAQVRIRARK